MWWTRQRKDEAASTPQERRDELLSAYLDGEASPAEVAEAETLLAADPTAQDDLELIRLMTSALAGLGEVRAPRSFAIPAPEAARGPRLLVSFRRFETFTRASAAAAGLLFVVALSVGGPSAAPMATMSSEAQTADGGAAALRAGEAAGDTSTDSTAGGGAAGAAPAPSLASPEAGSTDETPQAELAAAATAEETPQAELAAAATAEDDTDRQKGAEPLEQLSAPSAGTFDVADTSDGVGGVAPALGTLAVLLAGLSALMTWTRTRGFRSGR